jgi:amino acid transporter
MSAQEWRVLDGEGKQQGPYSFQDLQAYYTSGNITHETMIWTEGLEEWVPAGRVEGLLPNVPQIVPLAPAPTVAVSTQPIASGGINLTPQIAEIASGVSHGGPQTKSPTNRGAPTWLSIVTIASGIIALILYFFPWVSISQDMNFFKEEKNVIKLTTQSGMQSITQTETPTDEANAQRSQQAVRTSVDKIKNDFEESENYKSSTLNLIAFIAIAIGVFFAFIGLLNKAKTLTMVGAISFLKFRNSYRNPNGATIPYGKSLYWAPRRAEKNNRRINQDSR